MTRRGVWTNWAREQRCRPVEIARPASEAELAETVARAAAIGRPVRAVGSGHSFTDCACTDGVMVDLRAMRRVLDADADSGRVTVEAGITLRELGLRLAALGLALPNQGDIDAQTLAGAIATSTHGTGARFANLSAPVVGARIVTASGQVVEVSSERDPDGLRAARVSVGALGVISSLTLEAVPAYTLHRRDEPRPLGEVLDRLDDLVDGADHFEFFVFPYTRTALTRASRRSEDRVPRRSRLRQFMAEDLIQNGALGVVARAGRAVPRAVPRLNRIITAAMGPETVADASHRVYSSPRRVRFTEMEYAIPRAHAREAVERALAAFEERRLPVGFPIEVRFGAGDDAFLSTAHGRETSYVAVHQFHGVEFETGFRAVEAIMDDYDGRPHWGKRHYQRAATLRGRYPLWDRFQAVRARLDPDGVFTNDYVRRTLGPVGAAAPAPA